MISNATPTHTLSVLVEDTPGVLARVASLFSRRGYNIQSLAVGATEQKDMSRMTIVVSVDESPLEQITKQLNKLIDVIKVTDLTQEKHLDRELALITVQTTPRTRSQVIELAALFRAQVVSVHAKSLTIQMVGPSDEVDNFMDLLQPFGIQDTSRSGTIAVAKAE